MKTKLLLLLFGVFIFSKSYAQYDGSRPESIGIRMGDPNGVTYKKHMSTERAVELVLGSSRTTSYRGLFDKKDKFNSYIYNGHSVNIALALQARYIMIHDWDLLDELYWYVGAGAEIRYFNVTYSYTASSFTTGKGDVSNIDIGPEIIIGSEYVVPGAPLITFVEISSFVEILDEPNFLLQGALGVRYSF